MDTSNYSDIIKRIIIRPIQGLLELLINIDFLSIFLEAGITEKYTQGTLVGHRSYYLIGNALGKASHKFTFVDSIDGTTVHGFCLQGQIQANTPCQRVGQGQYDRA